MLIGCALQSTIANTTQWNDYGESHYVGPLNSPHIDDGNSKWVNDMYVLSDPRHRDTWWTSANDSNRPHDGFLQMAKPYIAAFKNGDKTVDGSIKADQLIYWYRPTLKSASCDSTDTCEKPWPSSTPNQNYFVGKPNGYDTMSDSVFVVALLTSPGTVTVTSGGTIQTFNANTGANSFQVPMNVGTQSFSLTRGGQTVLSGDSMREIISDCVCGIYNFNSYVGTLPAGRSDPLQPDGLKSFTVSLQATCQATPSLGTAPSGGGPVATVNSTAAASSGAGSSQRLTSPTSVTPTSTTGTSTTAVPSPSNVAPPINSITTAPAPVLQPPTLVSTTTTTPAAGGSGTKTITALSQLFPTNCMHAGYVWDGPPGSDPAAYCDGG